ncbi:hypothetical protein KDK_82380 [Dictyobacter kobayashii]|uniref:Uncharacterized protein n=1 Tax=Dictyobacter kobayashii TaxID=2014872 RepID=A0A402AZD2_9CHLR|nr:hypothetical protein KDK_82380 [Dictyobacter kobayashii]
MSSAKKTHRMVHSARRLKSFGRGFLPVYTLTRIYSVEYTKGVEPVFEIIAEPIVLKYLREAGSG